MNRPLLLDLFCGAGGAAMGYHRAGFDIIGVDIEPQPNYPFEFHQGDALEFLAALSQPHKLIQAIHASPPCQHYSLVQHTNENRGEDHPDLIPPTRELLSKTGLPFVIENVVGAPLRYPITLCGEMFGLQVIRHRLFESNMLLLQPSHPRHRGYVTSYRHGVFNQGPYYAVYGTGGERGSLNEWQAAMGMPWCREKRELAEAIPPAYTEYIGDQLLQALEVAA